MPKSLSPSRLLRRATVAASLIAALFCALPLQAQSSSTARAASVDDSASQSGVVNINSASQAELERLPGIGPSKAKAILALRDRVKRFERVEDIMRVKGIGRKTFRTLRPMLSLSGATSLQPPVKAKRDAKVAQKTAAK